MERELRFKNIKSVFTKWIFWIKCYSYQYLGIWTTSTATLICNCLNSRICTSLPSTVTGVRPLVKKYLRPVIHETSSSCCGSGFCKKRNAKPRNVLPGLNILCAIMIVRFKTDCLSFRYFFFLRCVTMFRYEDLSLSYISDSLLQINLWRISLCEVNFQPPFYILFCSQKVKKPD